MALGLWVCDRDGPHVVAAVVAADEYLLAVENVLVAVADGLGLHVGQVGPGLWFGEELPGPNSPSEDGRQEGLLLLLGAPDEDGVAAKAPAGVIVGREGQAEGVDLLLDDHGAVNVEAAATVFGGCRGPEPAIVAQLAAEVATQLVLVPGEVGGVGGVFHPIRDMLLQPGADLAAELFLFGGVTRFKVHGSLRV